MTENTTQTSTTPSYAPNPEAKRLAVLVGTWHTEWQTQGSDTEPATALSGTDIYQWAEGEYALLHYVRANMGDGLYRVVELIGYDTNTKTFRANSFDVQGNALTYEVKEEAGVWTFTGDKTRSTLKPAQDGMSMTAQWERSEDGSEWEHWMDMQFTKRA